MWLSAKENELSGPLKPNMATIPLPLKPAKAPIPHYPCHCQGLLWVVGLLGWIGRRFYVIGNPAPYLSGGVDPMEGDLCCTSLSHLSGIIVTYVPVLRLVVDCSSLWIIISWNSSILPVSCFGAYTSRDLRVWGRWMECFSNEFLLILIKLAAN